MATNILEYLAELVNSDGYGSFAKVVVVDSNTAYLHVIIDDFEYDIEVTREDIAT